MKNLINISSLSEKTIRSILTNASQFKNFHCPTNSLTNKIISTMFFEPSTRTQMSFQTAAYKLGANVLNYDHSKSSSKKGESLEDTIKTMSQYSDALVIRHPNKGVMDKLAKASSVPIINAGDGNGEHPTQALLDLFTIEENFSSVTLNITFVGDLKNGRTVHSTMQLLDKMYSNVTFYFVNNSTLDMDDWYTMNLRNPCHCKPSIESVIGITDVLYMTRIQNERIQINNTSTVKSENILTKSLLSKSKKDMIVLHPLPRNEELPEEIDDDPKCKIIEQMKNGVFVRMSILQYLISTNEN